MSQKAYIIKSDSNADKYRLVLNVTDVYSTGVIMNRVELSELLYQIKDLLEMPAEVVSGINQEG